MKIRQDFVTNSSSSSFIISKSNLDDEQIEAIRNHSELGQRLNMFCAEEAWGIEENEEYITGYTWMDNFSISDLFDVIGVMPAAITWSEYPISLLEVNATPQKPRQHKSWREHVREITSDNELQETIEDMED